MSKKNLYKEEEYSDGDEDIEEDDDVVDYNDMVIGMENHTGINFFKNEKDEIETTNNNKSEEEEEDEEGLEEGLEEDAEKEIKKEEILFKVKVPDVINNNNIENKDKANEFDPTKNSQNVFNNFNTDPNTNTNTNTYTNSVTNTYKNNTTDKNTYASNEDKLAYKESDKLTRIDEDKLFLKEDKLDLLDLDLESMPKDDLINLLLISEETPEKKKKKFKLNPKPVVTNPNTIYSNMLQMSEMKDPELSGDFNVALTKILTKMVKESNNPNQEVLDILLADREKVEEELRKYEFTKKTKIEEKVKNYIDKKNKNLETIQEKLNEDFQKVCTFTPNVANTKTNNNKRNLEQFLEAQDTHQKKIQTKLENLREDRIKERINDYQTAPKINEVSKKIVEEKIKNDLINNSNNPSTTNGLKVHERLYNKRSNANLVKNLPVPVAKNVNANIKLGERTQSLYQDAANRQNKQKEIMQNKNKNDNMMIKSSQNSNKYFFKKFKFNFREEVERLLHDIFTKKENNSTSGLNKLNFSQMNSLLQNLSFITIDLETDEESSSVIINPLLSKHQERRLLVDLYDNVKDSEGLVNIDHLFIFCLSILNILEYFIVKSYQSETEKPLEENITTNNLLSSQSTKSLKSSASNAKILNKKNSALNIFNEDAYNNIVHKLNLDLNARIQVNKKYGGLDEDKNLIITFTHAKLIFKDFNIFYLNYNNNNIHKRGSFIKSSTYEEEMLFKPKINPKSVQLSNKYRQKVISELDIINSENKNTHLANDIQDYTSTNSNNTNNNSNNTNNNNYNLMLNSCVKINQAHIENPNFADINLMKKKKQEKINDKIREERDMRELEQCTFKPKINSYQYKDNIVPVDSMMRDQRIEILYKKGTEILINKKDKTKDEFEVEKYGNECTFKPVINNERAFEMIFEKENVKDKDVDKFNERMRRGRLEREIKESVFRRGEDFISPRKILDDGDKDKDKEKEKDKRTKSENKANPSSSGTSWNKKGGSSVINSINNKINEANNRRLSQNKESGDNHKKYENYVTGSNNVKTYQGNKNIENQIYPEKSLIPLLIIDVNIRPGDKKQITVYEGDTADKLAADFSFEHSLDNNTRNKLQVLIQSQLSRLLSKIIEEENQSIRSEISNGFV